MIGPYFPAPPMKYEGMDHRTYCGWSEQYPGAVLRVLRCAQYAVAIKVSAGAWPWDTTDEPLSCITCIATTEPVP